MASSPPEPEATSSTSRLLSRAALLVGLALAIDVVAGSALLLYTTQGFLRAAGLLISVSIGALAAGLWVGGTEPGRPRGRWTAALLVYLAAAVGVAAWTTQPQLRSWPLGGPVAMALTLAFPAYVSGLVLAQLVRAGAGAGLAALSGVAAGVLIATASLVPRLDAPVVFAFAATLIFVALLGDWRRAGSTGGPMAGDVVIISGVSARGQLGFALAERFAKGGARLVLCARSLEVVELARELEHSGTQALGVQADLTVSADAQRVVDTALARFGRLDAVVNAAGGLRVIRPVAESSYDDFADELARNLGTAVQLTRAALPALRETRGSIVNFASPAALRAPAALAAYSAAKAGVIAFTRAVAVEERAHGVRANAIAPGIMDTAQNREGAREGARFVTREEVADVVVFLCSPAARGITGETVQVLGATIG